MRLARGGLAQRKTAIPAPERAEGMPIISRRVLINFREVSTPSCFPVSPPPPGFFLIFLLPAGAVLSVCQAGGSSRTPPPAHFERERTVSGISECFL